MSPTVKITNLLPPYGREDTAIHIQGCLSNTKRVRIGKGPLCGGSAEPPNSLCSKGLALHIDSLVKRRGREEAREHYSFTWGGKGRPVGNKGWRWQTTGEEQIKEEAVKVAGSEGTGLNGWQRVCFAGRSAEEVTRDTGPAQAHQLAFPSCSSLNAVPAAASSAAGARDTEPARCRADVDQHDPEKQDCIRSVSHKLLCQKVQAMTYFDRLLYTYKEIAQLTMQRYGSFCDDFFPGLTLLQLIKVWCVFRLLVPTYKFKTCDFNTCYDYEKHQTEAFGK